MAVGSIWYQKTKGLWVTGTPYTKLPDGQWKTGANIYEKTGTTTWTLRYNGDITPPAAPPLFVNSYDTTLRTMTTTFTAPADADVVQMCCKISKTAYPTNPGVSDANSPTTAQTDGTPFWLWTTTPSGKSTRKHTGFVAGQKYYMSAWAKDSAGNWSAPVNYTWTFSYPPAPVKTLTTKSAYVTCTDSCSYRAAYGWRTDNNYVFQAGDQNLQGFWFYGTSIATLLKNAVEVTAVKIYVQRVNSAHGVSGDANIMIGHHTYTSQPSGAPASNAITGEYNAVDLGRGEGAWVTLNNTWDAEWKAGTYRGLGMQYQTTSVTSSYYAYCYGAGTSSGKLQFTWTEYV